MNALALLMWVDSKANLLPVVGPVKRRATGVLLDRLFGPAEDFDYVSATAPNSPPPAYQ